MPELLLLPKPDAVVIRQGKADLMNSD